MNTRAVVVTVVLCTLAVVLAIAWPRFMPRYEEDALRGVVVDRWTGAECRILLTGSICTWEDVSRGSLMRDGARWR